MTTVEPLHEGHLVTEQGGRCGEVVDLGGWGGTDFLREHKMFIVLISGLLYPIMVIQSYIIYTCRLDKTYKKLELCFQSKC